VGRIRVRVQITGLTMYITDYNCTPLRIKLHEIQLILSPSCFFIARKHKEEKKITRNKLEEKKETWNKKK